MGLYDNSTTPVILEKLVETNDGHRSSRLLIRNRILVGGCVELISDEINNSKIEMGYAGMVNNNLSLFIKETMLAQEQKLAYGYNLFYPTKYKEKTKTINLNRNPDWDITRQKFKHIQLLDRFIKVFGVDPEKISVEYRSSKIENTKAEINSIEQYKLFLRPHFKHNNYQNLMPALIKEDFIPMNTADIIKARLDAIASENIDEIYFWMGNHFTTTDAAVYPKRDSDFSGRFKIDFDSKLLTCIDKKTSLFRPETHLFNWTGTALPISNDYYFNIKGPEFRIISYYNIADHFDPLKIEYAILNSKAELLSKKRGEKYRTQELYELGATPIERPLKIIKIGDKEVNEVENSDLWLALSHYDFTKEPTCEQNKAARQLRDDYSNVIFREVIKLFLERKILSGSECMGISLFEPNQPVSMILPWIMKDFRTFYEASGTGNFGGICDYLVGYKKK